MLWRCIKRRRKEALKYTTKTIVNITNHQTPSNKLPFKNNKFKPKLETKIPVSSNGATFLFSLLCQNKEKGLLRVPTLHSFEAFE